MRVLSIGTAWRRFSHYALEFGAQNFDGPDAITLQGIVAK
jgi:hypothetical protein